jgi:AraC-like DNA-binding protein
LLERVRDFLDHNYTTPIDVNTVATLTRFTPNYLNSLFSEWMGQGIHEYLIALRMRKAMELCRAGELLVKEVAQQLGYSDPLYFSRAFRRYHGCWPSDAGARA